MIANRPAGAMQRTRTAGLRARWLGVWLAMLGAASMVWVPSSEADVLVLRDGSRVETDGAWEVRGRQVLFTLPNGTLSSMRLDAVDLDASRAATDGASNPRAEPQAEDAEAPRADVLVLTNRSMGLGPDGVEAEPEPDVRTGGSSDPNAEVRVLDWTYGAGAGDAVYELTGTVINEGRFEAKDLSVYLDIVAVDELTEEPEPSRHLLRRARIESSSLLPGDSTSFRLEVSEDDLRVHGRRGFADPVVSFDVQYRRIPLPELEAEGDRGGDAEAEETVQEGATESAAAPEQSAEIEAGSGS